MNRPYIAPHPPVLRLPRRAALAMLLVATFGLEARAQLTCNVDTIKYPSVKISFSRDGFASVSNTGSTDRTITSVKIIDGISAPGEFQVIQGGVTPVTLTPSEINPILVRFKPQLPGLRTAMLRVTSATDTISVQLQGFGLSIEPDIVMYPSKIDFGVRLPGQIVDTIVTAVASGPDSATVQNFTVANDNAIICFDAMPNDPATILPLVLHAGDSLAFHVRFIPTLPRGVYTGQLIAEGIVTGAPMCELTGRVEEPDFVVTPGLVDFGVVIQGGTFDTVIYVINTSHFPDRIEALSPVSAPFSYVNPPTLPYFLPPGDTLVLHIRLDGSQAGQFSTSVDVTEHSPPIEQHDRLTLIEADVRPVVLTSNGITPMTVLCGADSTYVGSLTVADTGIYPAVIDALRSDNVDVRFSGVSLPDTIAASSTRTYTFRLHATSALQHDTTIFISLFRNNKAVVTDSVVIHVRALTSAVSLRGNEVAGERSIVVVPTLDAALGAYGVESIVFDVTIAPAEIADLDLTRLTSALGSGVSIIAVPQGLGSYRITLTSLAGPITGGFDSLLAFGLKYYVVPDSIATVTITTTSPEKSGCLDFTPTTISLAAPNQCGDPELRSFVRGYSARYAARIANNPTASNIVTVEVTTPQSSWLTTNVLTMTGATVREAPSALLLPKGISTRSLDVSALQSGSYLLELRFESLGAEPVRLTERFTIIR